MLLVQSQASPSFYRKLIIYTHSSEAACWEVKLLIYLGVFWFDYPLLSKLFYYQYSFWIESSLILDYSLNFFGRFFNFKGMFGLFISFNLIYFKAIVLVGVKVFLRTFPWLWIEARVSYAKLFSFPIFCFEFLFVLRLNLRSEVLSI